MVGHWPSCPEAGRIVDCEDLPARLVAYRYAVTMYEAVQARMPVMKDR